MSICMWDEFTKKKYLETNRSTKSTDLIDRQKSQTNKSLHVGDDDGDGDNGKRNNRNTTHFIEINQT